MKTFCRVTLLGNISRDPDLKTTQSGQTVSTFGLATNRVWKDSKGEKQSLAEFHNLVAWSQLAEFCAKYVKKGMPVYAEGYLKTRTWDNNDHPDVKMYRTEIIVDNVVLLSAREQTETSTEPDPF